MKDAFQKFLKVFLWHGLSAAVPVWVAFAQEDPRFVLLAPAVNAFGFALLKWLQEKWPESKVAAAAAKLA